MSMTLRIKRAELADQIEQLLEDGKIRTVEDVCTALKKKRGVQNVLETDPRFRLAIPSKVAAKRGYTLVNQPVRPVVETRGRTERPSYVEIWTNNPFQLMHKDETMVVDATNVLGRKCNGMTHEGGKCPQPVPLWPLLTLLAQAKTAHNHTIFFVDASTRHHVQEKGNFEKLVETGVVMEVPASYTADSKLLAWADKNNSAVLTDDVKMRWQYMALYPWTNDPTRFIGHMIDDEAHKEISYVRKQPQQVSPSPAPVATTSQPHTQAQHMRSKRSR